MANALIEIAPTFIKWPTNNYMMHVKNSFNAMGFSNTIGIIDGTYIPIPLPKEEGMAYICKSARMWLLLTTDFSLPLWFSAYNIRIFKKVFIYSHILI
jgi:hypothetical protein